MDRNVFLVDFENVNRLAFTGVSALTETDEVIVLYTKACIKTPKALEDFYLKTKATLTMMYAENGHKNALDFQLSALLGRLSCEERFKTKYYIIAKDKGYDCLSIFLNRFGIDVIRRESIYAAITGMEDPIAMAQVETEEEDQEERLEEVPASEEEMEEELEQEEETKKAKKKKKDKKKKKEGKAPKEEKQEEKPKKGKASKEASLILVGMPRPWSEDSSLRPVSVKEPIPEEKEVAPASENQGGTDYTLDNLTPELALVVQAIRERFSGPYEGYQELAIETYLYAKGHPEEGKNMMEVAHRMLAQRLRAPAKVKKVYAFLKPFLK